MKKLLENLACATWWLGDTLVQISLKLSNPLDKLGGWFWLRAEEK